MRFGFGALVFSHGEQRSALKQMPKTKQQQQQFTHTHTQDRSRKGNLWIFNLEL